VLVLDVLVTKEYRERVMVLRTGKRGKRHTRKRARNTGGSSESTKNCGGCCNLRRAIPAAWGHDLERDEGEMEERRGLFIGVCEGLKRASF
jgi:hypothetical protein